MWLNDLYHFISGGFRGGGGGGANVRPPPPKIDPPKKRKSVLVLLFFHIWWLKMQDFPCSLRSPTLFNIIINIALLKDLENNICSYNLSSFYMAGTVATGKGNFDMKIQDFRALKSLNCRSFPGGGGLRPPDPPPGLRPGPDWGPRRSPNPSPNFAPSNSNTWIRACLRSQI